MGSVQFDTRKAQPMRPHGGVPECRDGVLDVSLGPRTRCHEAFAILHPRGGTPGGPPTDVGRCPHATVEQLHDARNAGLGQGGPKSLQRRLVGIAAQSELTGPGLALLRDVGGTGLDDAEAATGPAEQPCALHLGERAIGM